MLMSQLAAITTRSRTPMISLALMIQLNSENSNKAKLTFYNNYPMQDNTHHDILAQHQTQIERIFVYYCSFADKENHTLLKMLNYKRLLNDLQLNITPELTSQLDIIVCSHASTSGLSLGIFMEVLGDVSQLLFQGENRDNAIKKMVNQHMEPLYDVIIKQTQFGQIISHISAQLFKENCFIFLKRFQSGLLSLFNVYFTGEGIIGKEEQFKMFSKLSRDLTLVPRVVNKPISYLIFVFLRQRKSKSAFEQYFHSQTLKNYGFGFICFLEYLIILSHINFKGEDQEIMKIYRLLELIEVSPGTYNLAKKTKFQHFLLTDKQLEQALAVKNPQILFNNAKTVSKMNRTVEPPIKKKLGRYYNQLKAKFTELCTKKQVQSNFYLPEEKAKHMLVAICPKLTTTSIDIFVNSVERINFENFIGILQRAAQSLSVNVDRLFDQVLDYNPQEIKLALVLKNIKLSKKEQLYCRQILRLTQSYLRSVFEYYETHKFLSLGSYIKCLQQMGAIPQILSPKQAYDIYKVCGHRQDHMTFSQFQESFLAITIAVHFQCDLEGVQRLVYLLEKICDSKRGEVLMKKNSYMIKQHPLYMLRLTFSGVYKQIQNKIESNNKISAEEIKLIPFSEKKEHF